MSLTPEELGQKIKEARDRQDQKSETPGPGMGAKDKPSGTAQALRAGTDLVAALVVGGFLGYWVDQWLGTTPWGMIILFFLGLI